MMTYEQLAQAYAQACRVRDMALAQLEDIGAGYAEKMDDFTRVVRCKDCMYYKDDPFDDGRGNMCVCWSDWLPTEPNDFCSYGERKEQ